MGALGLEGWGRRPQGKGCLLLAVAGTTSLVTLLLAVPLTVLAVLVVAPQKQGLVSGCSRCPGGLVLLMLLTAATPGGALCHLLSWPVWSPLGWFFPMFL